MLYYANAQPVNIDNAMIMTPLHSQTNGAGAVLRTRAQQRDAGGAVEVGGVSEIKRVVHGAARDGGPF